MNARLPIEVSIEETGATDMSDERKQVLVIDHNWAVGKVIAFNLENSGFDAEMASNPQVALNLMSQHQFDLIITDYQMPEEIGAEFVRSLRQDERYAHTPVLMCSAKGFETDTERLMEELDIARVLVKPYNPREIVELARSILESV